MAEFGKSEFSKKSFVFTEQCYPWPGELNFMSEDGVRVMYFFPNAIALTSWITVGLSKLAIFANVF